MREIFKIPKIGTIAGCMVTDGRIIRSGDAQARLLRDNVVVYEGKIASLRRFKDDVSEVKPGFECGIGLDRFNDLKVGDIIEVFVVEKVAAAAVARLRVQQHSRPQLAEQIRQEVSDILAREVRDPGIGFLTLTRVKVAPDLQQARVYYTILGDPAERKKAARALERALPFIRRALAARLNCAACPSSPSSSTSPSRTRRGSKSCSRKSSGTTPNAPPRVRPRRGPSGDPSDDE